MGLRDVTAEELVEHADADGREQIYKLATRIELHKQLRKPLNKQKSLFTELVEFTIATIILLLIIALGAVSFIMVVILGYHLVTDFFVPWVLSIGG